MANDAESGGDAALQVLPQIVNQVPVFMLTARLPDGSLRSMPVARIEIPFDGEIWLFADPAAAAVGDLASQPQVNLSFADVPQCRYVSLSGPAERVEDPRRARELWNPNYREWLPQGLQDPLHGLFRVTVQHAEYWDATHSVMRQMGGLMKGVFTGNRPAVGDHESIDLP